jgi:hypothetical protein
LTVRDCSHTNLKLPRESIRPVRDPANHPVVVTPRHCPSLWHRPTLVCLGSSATLGCEVSRARGLSRRLMLTHPPTARNLQLICFQSLSGRCRREGGPCCQNWCFNCQEQEGMSFPGTPIWYCLCALVLIPSFWSRAHDDAKARLARFCCDMMLAVRLHDGHICLTMNRAAGVRACVAYPVPNRVLAGNVFHLIQCCQCVARAATSVHNFPGPKCRASFLTAVIAAFSLFATLYVVSCRSALVLPSPALTPCSSVGSPLTLADPLRGSLSSMITRSSNIL